MDVRIFVLRSDCKIHTMLSNDDFNVQIFIYLDIFWKNKTKRFPLFMDLWMMSFHYFVYFRYTRFYWHFSVMMRVLKQLIFFVILFTYKWIMPFFVPRHSSRSLAPTTAGSTSGAARTWSCLSRPGCVGARWRLYPAPTWDTSSARGRPTSGARGSTCLRGTPSVFQR